MISALLVSISALAAPTEILAGGGAARHTTLLRRLDAHQFAAKHRYAGGRKLRQRGARFGGTDVVHVERRYSAAQWKRLRRALGDALPDPSRPRSVTVLAPYRRGTLLRLPSFVAGETPGVPALRALSRRLGDSSLTHTLYRALEQSGNPRRVVGLANAMMSGERPPGFDALALGAGSKAKTREAAFSAGGFDGVASHAYTPRLLAAVALVKPEVFGNRKLRYTRSLQLKTHVSTSSRDRTVRVRQARKQADGSVVLHELRYPLAAVQSANAQQTHLSKSLLRRDAAAHSHAERSRVMSLAAATLTTAESLHTLLLEVNARSGASWQDRIDYENLGDDKLRARVRSAVEHASRSEATYGALIAALARRAPNAFERSAKGRDHGLPATLDPATVTADQLALVGARHIRSARDLARVTAMMMRHASQRGGSPSDVGGRGVAGKWRELVFWARRRGFQQQLVSATATVAPALFVASKRGATAPARETPWWKRSSGRFDALVRTFGRPLAAGGLHLRGLQRKDAQGRTYKTQFGDIRRPIDRAYDLSLRHYYSEGDYGNNYRVDVRISAAKVSLLHHVYLEFQPNHTLAQRQVFTQQLQTAAQRYLDRKVDLHDRHGKGSPLALEVRVKIHPSRGSLDPDLHRIKVFDKAAPNTQELAINVPIQTMGHELAHRILGSKDEYVSDRSKELAPMRLTRVRRPHKNVISVPPSLMGNWHLDRRARPIHFGTIADAIGRLMGRRLVAVVRSEARR